MAEVAGHGDYENISKGFIIYCEKLDCNNRKSEDGSAVSNGVEIEKIVAKNCQLDWMMAIRWYSQNWPDEIV